MGFSAILRRDGLSPRPIERDELMRRKLRNIVLGLLLTGALGGGIAWPIITSLWAHARPYVGRVVDEVKARATDIGDYLPDLAPDTSAAAGQASAALEQLPVKGRAPKTGYSRDQFGPAWSDDVAVDGGRNGCDQRNDVLRRDLQRVTIKPGTHGCVVLAGVLQDPYSGRTIQFRRGPDSATVQIDHIVALSDAWQSGAQQLSVERRRALAGDPLNLLAVDGPTNAAKSDGNAASWLPPTKAERCSYVARQIAVKRRYQLSVTGPEKQSMQRVLSKCPGQGVPPVKVPPLG